MNKSASESLDGHPYKMNGCAAEAIFCCTTENSHHREASQWYQKIRCSREDIRKKNGEMSCNFGEIIKKLYFLVCWKAARGLPTPPPHLSASRYRTFYTWWTASANRKCEIYSNCENHSREGGVICETVPFDNRSLDRLQTQNEDSQ